MPSSYVPVVIGRKGCNTKSIYEQTGCKVRVRGRGSGHIEMHSGEEAPTNLMLAVTAEPNNKTGFLRAVSKSIELLWTVDLRYQEDHAYCEWAETSPAFSVSVDCEDVKAELAKHLGREFAELPLHAR